MKIKFGPGKSEFGPGVLITLNGDEVVMAIDHWLHAQGFYVNGPRTVRVGGVLGQKGSVYVDPSGHVMYDGQRHNGNGTIDD